MKTNNSVIIRWKWPHCSKHESGAIFINPNNKQYMTTLTSIWKTRNWYTVSTSINSFGEKPTFGRQIKMVFTCRNWILYRGQSREINSKLQCQYEILILFSKFYCHVQYNDTKKIKNKNQSINKWWLLWTNYQWWLFWYGINQNATSHSSQPTQSSPNFLHFQLQNVLICRRRWTGMSSERGKWLTPSQLWLKMQKSSVEMSCIYLLEKNGWGKSAALIYGEIICLHLLEFQLRMGWVFSVSRARFRG